MIRSVAVERGAVWSRYLLLIHHLTGRGARHCAVRVIRWWTFSPASMSLDEGRGGIGLVFGAVVDQRARLPGGARAFGDLMRRPRAPISARTAALARFAVRSRCCSMRRTVSCSALITVSSSYAGRSSWMMRSYCGRKSGVSDSPNGSPCPPNRPMSRTAHGSRCGRRDRAQEPAPRRVPQDSGKAKPDKTLRGGRATLVDVPRSAAAAPPRAAARARTGGASPGAASLRRPAPGARAAAGSATARRGPRDRSDHRQQLRQRRERSRGDVRSCCAAAASNR